MGQARLDVDDRLAPDHLDALDAGRVLVLERPGRWVGFASAVWKVLLGYRRAAGSARPGLHYLESAHIADLVWFTEFPNGSPSSSMTDGGM